MRLQIRVKDGLKADDALFLYRIRTHIVEDNMVEVGFLDYDRAIEILQEADLLEKAGIE